jgi:membrane protein
VGIGVFLFGASGVFIQLTKALNRIWDVPPAHLSGIAPMIRQRFLSFVMVGAVGILLLFSLVLSASVSWMEHYLGAHFGLGKALGGLPAIVTSLGLFTLLFTILFKVLPEVALEWRHVWVGGAVSAVLFDMGRNILGFYLGRTHFMSLFGAAGSLTALMLWVFYGALIVLFGAEFTRVYTRRSRKAAGLAPDPPRRRKH